MLSEYIQDDDLRERFQREAATLKSLDHPNIMPVYATGEQDGMLYFVMPLVRGPSLYELLGRRRFSPVTAWQILDPVTNALDYMRGRGWIDRAIKPANL